MGIANNTHVYCTNCRHLEYVSVNNDDTGTNIQDDGLIPSCRFSCECCLDDPEDSRPYAERPHYEELQPEPELGNLLFGNFRGGYPLRQREEMQDIFGRFLDKFGCDCYGNPGYDAEKKAYILPGNTKELATGFGNDTFEIHPYYWGDDDDLAEIPNFIYRPAGLEMRWYKYPLRDAWSNIGLTPEMLKDICEKCLQSLSGEAGHDSQSFAGRSRKNLESERRL